MSSLKNYSFIKMEESSYKNLIGKAAVGFLLLLTVTKSCQSFKNLEKQENKNVSTRNLLFKNEQHSSHTNRVTDLNKQRNMIDNKDQASGSDGSLKGNNQARTYSEDLLSSMMSVREDEKKMSTNGFIPIVKNDPSKEENQDDSEQEDETSQQEQQTTGNLLPNSLQPLGTGYTNFPEQPQYQYQDDTTEGIRAGRKFPGGELLSALLGQNSKQYPINIGLSSHLVGQVQRPAPLSGPFEECICVPFFQCRDGYLGEAQVRKGQLQLQKISRPYNFKVPRALGQQKENLLVQNQEMPTGSLLNIADEQQVSNDELIYEQLRKTIEKENLEQAANYQLLNERSLKETNQNMTEKSLIESDLVERSLLNPLVGLHRPLSQRGCGIMRTCCKFPPRPNYSTALHHFANNRPLHQHRVHQSQIIRPATSTHVLNHPHISHLKAFQHQHQQQTSGENLAQASSLINYQQPANSLLVMNQHHQLQQNRQPGDFMAARCGLRQAIGVSGRVQNYQPILGSESTAEFGEFPAHVAILKRLSSANGDSLFLCSAVLISNTWLATAAHCVRRLRAEELRVRLGEWDVGRDDEFYPFVESNIREIVIHPEFQPSSLINDLALLRMDITIDPKQMPHITPACLSVPGETFVQQRCWLTGWGKDAFGQVGSFQSILKKVDLPVVGRHECETAFRYQTKLGQFFRLHPSAMCAGGERGKDACEGDGGAGLYCTDPTSGLTKVAGLVSWGIGCGQVGVPGVYTNLAHFYAWIEQVVASGGEEGIYLDRNDNSFDGTLNIINERNSESTSNSTQQTNLSLPSANATADSNQLEVESELESRAG